MIHLLCLAFLLCLPASAFALDSSDIGTYAIIHRDGHVTDFTFFVSLTASQWNVEQKNPNGSWSNVTCERDCILRASEKTDISRFFPANILKDVAPSCVHNSAFAFCSFASRSRSENRSYVLIALVTQQPTPVWLKKLSNERRAP